MRKNEMIHRDDVFIDVTASFLAWLSDDLERFLKQREDKPDVVIQKLGLIEERKQLLRKLLTYLDDIDIQTNDSKKYKRLDMAVRYGKAVTKNVLERPIINNFNADIRDSIAQQDQELAEKYVAFIRDLYEITDPARIYIEINDQLEQAIYQLQIVLTTKGSGKKTELRKFTRALEELDHFIDTQLTTKLFEEFVENECHTIEGYDLDSSHDKLVDHIIYLWVEIFKSYHQFISNLVKHGKNYDLDKVTEELEDFEYLHLNVTFKTLDLNRAYLFLIGWRVEKYEVISAPDSWNIETNRSQQFNPQIIDQINHEQSN